MPQPPKLFFGLSNERRVGGREPEKSIKMLREINEVQKVAGGRGVGGVQISLTDSIRSKQSIYCH
ncbi:hypothetical protein Hdeb2414_s0113g00798941 [Helianthus debilis subsp. tardiflorus]